MTVYVTHIPAGDPSNPELATILAVLWPEAQHLDFVAKELDAQGDDELQHFADLVYEHRTHGYPTSPVELRALLNKVQQSIDAKIVGYQTGIVRRPVNDDLSDFPSNRMELA